MKVDCIITAAGLSSRMGRWKPALPWRGQSLLTHSITNALPFCQQMIVVVGHQCDAISDLLPLDEKIRVVLNPNYPLGLFCSQQFGASLSDADYMLFVHADMPNIAPTTYQALLDKAIDEVVIPFYHGQHGHPVLIPGWAREAITQEPTTGRMKKLLDRLGFHRLDLEDAGICLDVDTPEAYQKLLAIE